MWGIIIVRRRIPIDEPKNIDKQRNKRVIRVRERPKKAYPIYPHRQLKELEFSTEKQKAQRSKRLYEDPEFPPEAAIQFHPLAEWRRPHRIVERPVFFSTNVSRHDIQQTGLGDCFFLAPLSLIADRPDLIEQVVPRNQSFGSDYAGIFNFNFWQHGTWINILVDDRLPVNVFTKKLKFTRARNYNVFWIPLIEKAFAKLYGGYANIHGGHSAYAMQNLTGGISVFNLWKSRTPEKLKKAYEKLLLEHKLGVLLCAKSGSKKIFEDSKGNVVTIHQMGLMPNHAYAVTDVRKIDTTNGMKRLVRIRNPWGRIEWNGDWSSSSSLWKTVKDSKLRRELLDKEVNGEYWMDFWDFVRFFKNIDRCYLGPEIMIQSENGRPTTKSSGCSFDSVHANGSWSSYFNTNGGGFPKGIQRGNFHRNPQYIVSFSSDQKSVADQKLRILLIWQIVQKYVREHGLSEMFISCAIYALTPEQASQSNKFPLKFFQTQTPVNKIEYSMLTSQRKKIKPGDYVFVPFCSRQNGNGFFLLRIFANGRLKMR
ncbi:Calpain catalytic domain-containing protein [Aphelenchoides bicaudatus]|nr:Calpain catalytic domain-containing protein [Aphelenchoides bicaudatus]